MCMDLLTADGELIELFSQYSKHSMTYCQLRLAPEL